MKAIRVHQHGGPDMLAYENFELGEPGPGEVRVRNRAIGVNFVDIYLRSGAYPPPQLPFIPGKEGAGEVVSVGPDVEGFKPGDRVAYAEALGAYAEEHNVPARVLVHLPEDIDFETGAAMMLKGLTAQYLLRRTFRVEAGHTLLVHAAAGGVGLILTQWAKHLGAKVIGTVGSPEKAELARANGADYVIDYGKENFATRVLEITEGEGVDVVYDSIGKATFEGSLDSLRPFGHFVSFGAASGSIPPFDITTLAQKGSLYATWPLLPAHLSRREDVLAMSKDLFDVVARGAVNIRVHASLPLAEAAEAHRRLEGRQTTGALVLLP
ncbi:MULTISPECIES: quinone oxidoreductase family protein [Ensifer]|uniref:Quinone oxidoreductase n=1 Tax=Ensifer adhaerens TaxID=106592 RepID=A0A9Q9DCG1_ENSAD|nr:MULTISPECIES: quinone oxidoreductase [Ensifer]MBD9596234.1 quinone oxidoreductase [Ensifer sp. ENS05]MBD9627877.1 quinone oxidoreductase [Ensifer sp. ENS06]QHG72230.1 quinone oxidoreductase [Ensifer adhaerens]RAS08938.1 NADPH:quinone reductase-like Zn-dependent oxidoreductase [Ensifer adhaerens]USJ26424.1 quinone oxidoreductase [Ensifer adhaerens]